MIAVRAPTTRGVTRDTLGPGSVLAAAAASLHLRRMGRGVSTKNPKRDSIVDRQRGIADKLPSMVKGPREEDIALALLLVVRVRKRLKEAEKLYKQCVEDIHAYRRRDNLLRRKALKAAGKMRAVIFDVRRELREKEPMLVRMAHEAKVGRLLESSKSLEELAKAYLNKEEWGLVQKSRHIQERRKLKLRLKEAERKHHDRDAEGRFAPACTVDLGVPHTHDETGLTKNGNNESES